MRLTGHKTESVYRRYAIADSKAQEEGVEKPAQPARGDTAVGRTVVPMQEGTG